MTTVIGHIMVKGSSSLTPLPHSNIFLKAFLLCGETVIISSSHNLNQNEDEMRSWRGQRRDGNAEK